MTIRGLQNLDAAVKRALAPSQAGTVTVTKSETKKLFTAALADDAQLDGGERQALAKAWSTQLSGRATTAARAEFEALAKTYAVPLLAAPGSLAGKRAYSALDNGGAVYAYSLMSHGEVVGRGGQRPLWANIALEQSGAGYTAKVKLDGMVRGNPIMMEAHGVRWNTTGSGYGYGEQFDSAELAVPLTADAQGRYSGSVKVGQMTVKVTADAKGATFDARFDTRPPVPYRVTDGRTLIYEHSGSANATFTW